MDYTSWCDDIVEELAAWLREQPYGLDGHLDNFNTKYLADRELPTRYGDAVADAVFDVFGAFGLPDNDKRLQLEYRQLTILTNTYDRWRAVFDVPVSDEERMLIEAVNRLSIVQEQGVFLAEDVRGEALLQEPLVQGLLEQYPEQQIAEALDDLARRNLIHQLKWWGGSEVKATYCGFTRLHRSRILQDREIDELRLQGESDSLDYKRVLDVASRKGKADFAKDVVAFANTGGNPIKHILVGVEDDGTFPQPDDREEHGQRVHSLKDTTLQQIVNDRTLHAPSVRIKAKGEHRDGPYTLIEITSKAANVPYRYFAKPVDSRAQGATAHGEVWVRKGTTKHLASPDEVADLERRGERVRRTFPE